MQVVGEERNADSGDPHFKLGFVKLAKHVDAHRANKRSAPQVLRSVLCRVSDACETLVQNCDAREVLILAIGSDKRPLASRCAARLIAAGQSAATVLEDMFEVSEGPLLHREGCHFGRPCCDRDR